MLISKETEINFEDINFFDKREIKVLYEGDMFGELALLD